MSLALPPEAKSERVNRLLTAWLFRLAALGMFFLGMEYWVRLVGFYDGALWRFDLMPVWWKVAASALAVLYPVAGVGLWLTVSWGVVLWAIVAIVEAVMHFLFPALFGGITPWVFAHLIGLSLLAILRIIGWLDHRKRLQGRG